MEEGIVVKKGSAFGGMTLKTLHGDGCDLCMELAKQARETLIARGSGMMTRTSQGSHWGEAIR